jgi:hypothetical protein
MKFTIENQYQMRFIGDSDLKVTWVCTDRTEKTVTLRSGKEVIKRKIKLSDGKEYVLYGSYSMAPVIRAN